jgi:hypothetical protein
MPYVKCEACKVRVRRVHEAVGLADPCPLCGRALQSVADLGELIGFPSVDARPDAPQDGISRAGHQRLAAAVTEVMAQRRAAERLARQHGERWTP